jgi:hypothetical protein
MTAAERVQVLADAMPDGSVISFPAEFMAELATELQVPATRPARPAPDIPLKVVEAAQLLGKAPSTIRGWLNEGRLP